VVATAVGRQALVPQGTVTVTGQTVRFMRTGLVEEYSVSLDGVRQDFVVAQKPAGDGELQVQLTVTGARVEPAAYGARLVLEKFGRKIAYSRLHATDAKGKELPARIEVTCRAASPLPGAMESEMATGAHGGLCPTLSIFVNDTGAVYPVRIDPTFSDANWVSMNPNIPGTDGGVSAATVDGSGNLYIGGIFKAAGNVVANNVAKWDGSTWSSLGSGLNSNVNALAVSGGTLYAGGQFTMAGGNAATNIAQWNGSIWSPLGSGLNGSVYALAVSGGTLYVGGFFTVAGTNAANSIAQWNGTTWSPLASGVNSTVYALAVSGGMLYAGGNFKTAGGNAATNIAQWNGSSWSALGSGMGPGLVTYVSALAVSGTNLYAGGNFTTAGGNAANFIAQWDGSNWSPLGSGMNNYVNAPAVSGGVLYAGGDFTTAGAKVSPYAAEATIGPPTIYSQPQSASVPAGSDANFALGANGQPLYYQWFKNGNALLNGGNVSGATSSSLWLANVSVNDPGYYLVVVTNNFGSVTSSVATLTVNNLPLVLLDREGSLGYTSNQFWLTVAGPAGSNAVLYASTDYSLLYGILRVTNFTQ
jgi:hypothetical protein